MINPSDTTVTEERADEPVPLDAGHPVRNFVGVLLLIAAVLGAIWWTGALTPRLEVTDSNSIVDSCTHRTEIWLRLANPAPFGIEVRSVRVSFSNLHVDTVTVGPDRGPVVGPNGRVSPTSLGGPLRPFHLGAGEARMVTAAGVLPGGDDSGPGPRVVVTARTPLGFTRTVAAANGRSSSLGSEHTGSCLGT